ncbi:MAG TPA: ice-binding family protein [Thermoanaerobaculia bacterium]|jgi:hypothetical protein|nr:ice-binding family protein [Thermoanaerobaculia bacterium]
MSFKCLIAIGLLFAAFQVRAQRPPPSLGTAASFAVLASTVTSSGSTVITGNLGGKSIHGFPPGIVLLGTTIHDLVDPLRDATAAYEDLRTRTCDQTLQGDGLAPRVYCSATPFILQGTLTLDAHNDPNAVWIFQLGGGLTTAPASAVRVINGGWEGNVFWQVNGEAVLGAGTAFIGNIIASKGMTLGDGASLSGRALVLDGTATLSGNSISLCCKPIEVFNPASSSVTAGVAFSGTFAQTGGSAPVMFTLGSGTLPVGLELAADGTLHGTTSQRGQFPITVRATDANHCIGTSAVYVLTVGGGCGPITITNPPIDSGTAGVRFSQTFTQTGAVPPAVFMTVSALPAGLVLGTTGTLEGIPLQTGSFPIIVRVKGADGCFEDSKVYQLVIGCPAITVTNPTNASGTAGMPFCERFIQTGGVGTATFTLAGGTLPPGWTLSSDGFLCGITNQTGPVFITVRVTDSNGCIGTSPQYDPVIGCQTITVANPAMTTGTVGTPFCDSFTANGILGTATFSYTGTLPPGVAFTNGVLCGTPTQAGSFPITVTATDTNGCKGTSQYVFCASAITQYCPAIEAAPVTVPPTLALVAYSQPLIVTGGTPPYIFNVTGGALPAGIGLNPATGLISGIPTVSADIDVVITITDANGCKGKRVYYPATIPVFSQWSFALLGILLGCIGVVASKAGLTR